MRCLCSKACSSLHVPASQICNLDWAFLIVAGGNILVVGILPEVGQTVMAPERMRIRCAAMLQHHCCCTRAQATLQLAKQVRTALGQSSRDSMKAVEARTNTNLFIGAIPLPPVCMPTVITLSQLPQKKMFDDSVEEGCELLAFLPLQQLWATTSGTRHSHLGVPRFMHCSST